MKTKNILSNEENMEKILPIMDDLQFILKDESHTSCKDIYKKMKNTQNPVTRNSYREILLSRFENLNKKFETFFKENA